MNPQAVAVDVPLYNLSLKFGIAGGIVDLVASRVKVNKISSTYYSKGREELQQNTGTARSPSGLANQVERAYALSSYLTKERVLRSPILWDSEKNADPQVDLYVDGLSNVQGQVDLETEALLKALITDDASWSNYVDAAAAWNSSSASKDIFKDIQAAKRYVRINCGFPATHIVIPPDLYDVMARDSALLAKMQATTNDKLISGMLPPTIFGLEVVTPFKTKDSAKMGGTSSILDLWNYGSTGYGLAGSDASKVLVFYKNPNAQPTKDTCTGVFRFMWDGYGVDGISVRRYSNEEARRDFVEYGNYDGLYTVPQAGCLIRGVYS